MNDVYKNIKEYKIDKERKILIVFDDVIADMINNKKLNSIVTELIIGGRKLNISLVFITQSYFKVPKDVRLVSTQLPVCSCHVTYAFRSESTLYNCLNVKEFFAQSRREI